MPLDNSPSDSQYRYQAEDSKRSSLLDKRALLAQELALVQGNLTLVDLPVLVSEGTFLNQESFEGNNFSLSDFIIPSSKDSLYYGTQDKEFLDKIVNTNWEKVGQFAYDWIANNSEVLNAFGIKDISTADPAKVVALCQAMVSQTFTYWDGLDDLAVSGRQQLAVRRTDEQNLSLNIDSYTVDQLIELQRGVCRHFGLVATGLYEYFKNSSSNPNLRNTFLFTINIHEEGLTATDVDHHAFNLFVGLRDQDMVLSVVDPTHSQNDPSLTAETYSDIRLPSVVTFLAEPHIAAKLSQYYSSEDLVGLLDQEISRISQFDLNSSDFDNADPRFQKWYTPILPGYLMSIFASRHLLVDSDHNPDSLAQKGYQDAVNFIIANTVDSPHRATFLANAIASLPSVNSNDKSMLAESFVTLVDALEGYEIDDSVTDTFQDLSSGLKIRLSNTVEGKKSPFFFNNYKLQGKGLEAYTKFQNLINKKNNI